MTRHIDNVRQHDILKSFGSGALGVAVGGKTFDSTAAHGAPGSRWVNKNGSFRAAGPAKVTLIKGNDRRENTYRRSRRSRCSARRRRSVSTISRHIEN